MIFKLPVFDKNSHKGQQGRVMIVGGSHKYYGAPILNALAAQSAGADLITLFLPEAHMQTAKNHSLNLFIECFVHPDLGLKDIAIIIQAAAKQDAVLIGSGIGDEIDTQKALKLILREVAIPMVIDAEALQPDILKLERSAPWLITPHRAEFKRLFGEEATPESVQHLAREHDLCIVVKGPTDIIAYKNDIYLNTTGCPQMRVGGTGDALAGIIASYISQGLPMFEAAKSACYYFGKLGEKLIESQKSLTSFEMIEEYSKDFELLQG